MLEVSEGLLAEGNGQERQDLGQTSTRTEAGLGYSASARKLQIFSGDPNQAENDTLDDCYLIVQKNVIADMFSSMHCPCCNMPRVVFETSLECRQGFSLRANLSCHNFHTFEKQFYLCQRLGASKFSNVPFDINIRATLAFRGIGCGYSAMQNWASVMNLPCKLSRELYASSQKKIEKNAAMMTFEDMSKKSNYEIRKAYGEVGVQPDSEGTLDIGVSFDGSWQKRGHTSHNGIGCTIDLLTGLPIDYEVLSNFSFKCKTSENKDAEWERKHKMNCPKNFDRTAGAMEVACAKILWNRSIKKHKFR